jgi:hypothetical protein
MSKDIDVLYLSDLEYFKVEPMPTKRDWMDQIYGKWGYKCIPLNVANQSGWQVLSPIEFCANWNGGLDIGDVEVHYHEEYEMSFAGGNFGYGILTIMPDFMIKTPKGISTHIKGVPNYPLDCLYPLEGVVETDWLPFTFTFNYKFTRPGEAIFRKGDPLFSFFPVKRKYLEKYKINRDKIFNKKETFNQYNVFEKAREEHIDKNREFRYDKTSNRYFQGFYSSGSLLDFGQISDPPQKQIKLDN